MERVATLRNWREKMGVCQHEWVHTLTPDRVQGEWCIKCGLIKSTQAVSNDAAAAQPVVTREALERQITEWGYAQTHANIHGGKRAEQETDNEWDTLGGMLAALYAAPATPERDALRDAIQRAARDLPRTAFVRIVLEQGAASVQWTDRHGTRHGVDVDADDRLPAEINAAVDAALAADPQQEPKP